ncbi:MAG: fatty acid desaturase, partial [Pleurocapsa sp.]
MILLWIVSLVWLLSLNLTSISIFLIDLAILARTFFQTGLFITTHEAIHQNICRNNKINCGIGQITSFLYALLPYQVLAKNHQLHHKYPATEKDPDFNSLGSNNFWFWYKSFMQKYQQGKQAWILLFGMTIIFWSLVLLHISILNIFLFWVMP